MPEQKLRIGVVEKNRNPYWDMVNAGWADAAARLDLQLDIRAPEAENVEAQRALLEDLVNDGVDAIAFVGTVDGPFDDICLEARRRGVVVASFDLDASRDHRSIFVGMTDPETIGRRVGERIASSLASGGLVLLQAGSAKARGAVGKLRGLRSALIAAGIETVVSEPDGEDVVVARERARGLFADHPGASAAIGVYGYHPAVLARAAEEAGSTAVIHGFDMLPETVELLKTGSIASSVWIREYYFGYLTAVALNDLVRLGSEDVLALYGGMLDGAGRSLELTPRVFTPDDVDEYIDWRAAHTSADRPIPVLTS
jgi:ribose transport system substrate-binding protein